jgi:hypothetical protein
MSYLAMVGRDMAVAAVVATLVYCGFFINPGHMAVFDAEYGKVASTYIPERSSLVSRRVEMEAEYLARQRDGSEIETKIEALRVKLKTARDAETEADLENLLSLEATLKDQSLELDKSVRRIASDIEELTRIVDRTQGQAENVYLVVRAVALGGLGSLGYILVRFMSFRRWSALFADGNLERTVAATMVGAIAAVVSFAVFHTGDVTIFDSPPPPPTLRPDFWRISILGLAAGVAAGYVYQRAARRMEDIFVAPDAAENAAVGLGPDRPA